MGDPSVALPRRASAIIASKRAEKLPKRTRQQNPKDEPGRKVSLLTFAAKAKACFSTGRPPSIIFQPMRALIDTPHPLLSTTQVSDFHRNFKTYEKAQRAPYSLAKVIREMVRQPARVTGFEMEVDQELRSLTHDRECVGTMVPIQMLSRRDLTVTGAPSVQTSVGEDVIPFLWVTRA